jgi:DNA-binding response OmpR family regulator
MSASVLLLESDRDNGEMYAVGLAMAGFEPVVATDPFNARGHITRDLPKAVIIGTSQLDGEDWELVRDLKADERTRNIPIIVVTSRIANSFAGIACERGCATVLLKPCLPDTLASVIRTVFRGASAGRRRARADGD